jgi:hypothetical protein
VGFRFSLVLSREITDDESAVLKDAGCSAATFGTDSLPTNAEVTVTKMDFDDTESPSLAEAIEAALEAVKTVPDLGVPGLEVPAQPAEKPDEAPGAPEESAAASAEPSPAAKEKASTNGSAEKKQAAKKPTARKTSAKKADAKNASSAAQSASDATDSAEDEPVHG